MIEHSISCSNFGVFLISFLIEKFSGNNDFGLWRVKMNAMLVQQGLVDEGLSSSLFDQEKTDIMDMAHSSIILSIKL